MKQSFEELRARYEGRTNIAKVDCTLVTELVGGQPATEEGIRGYVLHHLQLTGDEAEAAVKRIQKEEIGEKPVPSEAGEQEERITYGLNVIRRDEFGPYLADWMAKACLKCAGTRLGIFQKKRGTKGDLVEMGEVHARGISLLLGGDPRKIYLRNPEGTGPAETYFYKFKGRVQTTKGAVSIVNEAECVPPGTRFAWEYRWAKGQVGEEEMADILAAAMVIGLGSVKSLERGKFRIDSCDITATKRAPKDESKD